MSTTMTAKQAEEVEAKQFLDFIDRVSTALFGSVFEDLGSQQQRADVLELVEAAHAQEVN